MSFWEWARYVFTGERQLTEVPMATPVSAPVPLPPTQYRKPVTTVEEAKIRYGEIKDGKWPNEIKWCSTLLIPNAIRDRWINSITGYPVTHVYCNNDLKGPLLAALLNIQSRGLIHELHTFDGCLMIRDVRMMPGKMSAHSYALAIDINMKENPLGGPSTLSLAFVKCFTDVGFDWGGDFKNRHDPMHFSFCWE